MFDKITLIDIAETDRDVTQMMDCDVRSLDNVAHLLARGNVDDMLILSDVLANAGDCDDIPEDMQRAYNTLSAFIASFGKRVR